MCRRQAERALRHYFSPGNLTALRELALRRTAQRVDEQMVTLHAGARDLRALGGRRARAGLRRRATRRPRRGALWPRAWPTAAGALDRPPCRDAHDAASPKRSATGSPRRCGWPSGSARETVTLPGRDVADDDRSTTRAPTTSPTSSSCKPRALALARAAAWLARARADPQGRRHRRPCRVGGPRSGSRRQTGSARDAWTGLASCAPISAASPSSRRRLASGMLLRQVLGVAQRRAGLPDGGAGQCAWPTGCGRRCSPASPACWPTISSSCRRSTPSPSPTPRTSSRCSSSCVVAVIASNLTARVRDQARGGAPARRRPRISTSSAASSPASRTSTICCGRPAFQIASMLKVRVVHAAARGRARVAVRAGYPPEDMLDEADLAAAKWSWENNRAGRARRRHAAGRQAACSCRCGPGAARSASSASTAIKPGPLLTPEQRRLLDALADQAALAIERVNLVEDVDRARWRPRPTGCARRLLTSISHDLRTPLASILGRRRQPQGLSRARSTTPTRRELLAHHPGGGGAAQPLHRQPARHDAAGIRRRRAELARHRLSATWSAAPCGAPAKILAEHRARGGDRRRPADARRSTPCCSSRCCSICSTMPRKYAPAGID